MFVNKGSKQKKDASCKEQRQTWSGGQWFLFAYLPYQPIFSVSKYDPSIQYWGTFWQKLYDRKHQLKVILIGFLSLVARIHLIVKQKCCFDFLRINNKNYFNQFLFMQSK